MRVKSNWHKSSVKTIEDIGSAMAFNSWRITKNQLEDLINEGFVVEKEQLFSVISEYLCFIIQCIDRLVAEKLAIDQREKLITKIAKQSAFYYQENKSERISDGNHWKDFIDKYNSRSKDYSKYGFDSHEPDYHFYRYFAERIQKAMTEADSKWIVQQMIEIQAPKTYKEVEKSVKNLTFVSKIITKNQQINQKKNKVARSKRPSTRKDIL
jgi:hypothetical protein